MTVPVSPDSAKPLSDEAKELLRLQFQVKCKEKAHDLGFFMCKQYCQISNPDLEESQKFCRELISEYKPDAFSKLLR